MQTSIDIAWWQLTLFTSILIVPIILNVKFSLGLSRDITLAITRMSIQLILVGLYLKFLFNLNSLLLNIVWLLVMLLVGASAIINSTKLTKQHLYIPVISGLLLGALPILLLLLVMLKPAPIYSAQYLIPLAGMLLGNSLNGNIVALQKLFTALSDTNDQYEAALALGATPMQATAPFIQSALQQSLAPILATMTATGLVTLPGMMTGQILGGVDPMVAIKYQLAIMVAIFVMLSVSVTTCLVLTVRTAINTSGLLKVTTINN